MSKLNSGQRCRCGAVPIPSDWSGVVIKKGLIHKHHYWDRCAEMVVYDEEMLTYEDAQKLWKESLDDL